jgi:hypothetical protein
MNIMNIMKSLHTSKRCQSDATVEEIQKTDGRRNRQSVGIDPGFTDVVTLSRVSFSSSEYYEERMWKNTNFSNPCK